MERIASPYTRSDQAASRSYTIHTSNVVSATSNGIVSARLLVNIGSNASTVKGIGKSINRLAHKSEPRRLFVGNCSYLSFCRSDDSIGSHKVRVVKTRSLFNSIIDRLRIRLVVLLAAHDDQSNDCDQNEQAEDDTNYEAD